MEENGTKNVMKRMFQPNTIIIHCTVAQTESITFDASGSDISRDVKEIAKLQDI
jgi:hypothetical protein